MRPLSKLLQGLHLTQLQVRAVFLDVLKYEEVPGPDAELGAGQAMVLWVADLLGRLSFLSPEQRILILQEAHRQLVKAGDDLADGKVELHQLAFADGRFVTCTGWTDFLDTESGERREQLGFPPLESVSYNLTTLYARRIQAMEGKDARTPVAMEQTAAP